MINNLSFVSRSLTAAVGLLLLVSSASAGELRADCDGWTLAGSWPVKAQVSAEVTLYMKVDGHLVQIDLSSDSTTLPDGGGAFILSGLWSLELPTGEYCVRATETVTELIEGGHTRSFEAWFGPFTCEKSEGDSQLVPTGYECDDFVNGTAPDLAFTVNPSGNIAPGAFFFYTRFVASGDTDVVMTTSTDPDEAQDSYLRGAKVFILENGTCRNISRQTGVTVSTAGNIATIHVPSSWVDRADGGVLIVRAEYNTRPGAAGDTHTFETQVNGMLVASEEITVQPQ